MSIEEFRKGNYSVRKSKYGNEKTQFAGRLYDSKKEANYARELETRRKASKPSDRVVWVEYQIGYPIHIRGTRICTYIADFRVRYGDGRIEVVDVKGVRTAIYKLKKKMVEAVYEIKIIEV